MSNIFRELWDELCGRQTPPIQTILWVLPAGLLLALGAFVLALFTAVPVSHTPRQAPVIMSITSIAEPVQRVEPKMAPVTFVAVTPVITVASPMVEHFVQIGQTLIGILKQYCRQDDYRQIARDNRINPDRIYAGKTVLRFQRGCVANANAPAVVVKRQEAPVVRSSVTSAPQAPLVQSAVKPSGKRSLSTELHQEITRVADLKKVKLADRSAAQQRELRALTGVIRQQVLAHYQLANPDCPYVEARKAGRTEREQVLFRVRCIRENFGQVIEETARKTGLERSYLEAMVYVESGGRPDAISPAGAAGNVQFMRASSKGFGLRDRFDPFASIRAGGRHLVDNRRRWNGDMIKATAHYNMGPGAGAKGFNPGQLPYVREVFRVQAIIKAGLPH
jgi:hypothetical protein